MITANFRRKRIGVLILLIFLLGGCNQNEDAFDLKTQISATPPFSEQGTITEAADLVDENRDILNSEAELITPTPIPLAPFIVEPDNCDSETVKGHILFRNTIGKQLFVMDGNGCDYHLVMSGVSGSPDWSADGKRISIGCEDDQYICILDAEKTLDSCLNTPSENNCQPVILDKYKLPNADEQNRIINTSLGGEGEKLLVMIRENSGYNTYLLDLDEPDQWRLIFKNSTRHWDLSPVNDEIMFDGLMRMPLDGGYLEDFHIGYDPVYSNDGKKIVFIYYEYEDKNNPSERIVFMECTFDAEIPWRQLYKPKPMDQNHWQTRNIVLASGFAHKLSLSPDGNYLAFSANYGHDYDSQIFRLDTNTGEVVVLSTKVQDHYYEAPAWGP